MMALNVPKIMEIISSLLISVALFLIVPSISSPEYRNYTYSAGNFTQDSPFNATLSTALSTLTTLSSSKHFSNVTVGSLNDDDMMDRVHALFSCQHDLPLHLCHSCVVNATQETFDFLTYSAKEAIFVYKECILRYANRMIFSSMELEPYNNYCTIIMYYTHATEIGSIIKKQLESLIDEATKSEDYFAVARMNNVIRIFELYFLVQCTPDITKEECNQCLLQGLNVTVDTCASEGRLSGHVIGPSCLVRYDTEPFFYTVVAPTIVAGGVPSNVSPPVTMEKKDERPWWVKFAKVCLSILLVLLFLYILFIKLRRACC